MCDPVGAAVRHREPSCRKWPSTSARGRRTREQDIIERRGGPRVDRAHEELVGQEVHGVGWLERFVHAVLPGDRLSVLAQLSGDDAHQRCAGLSAPVSSLQEIRRTMLSYTGSMRASRARAAQT